jgi:hypothetical protein
MQTVDPKQGKIKFSDLYRSIINDILSVNLSDVSAMRDNNGEPLAESLQQFLQEGSVQGREAAPLD